jgi:hypothetical protein
MSLMACAAANASSQRTGATATRHDIEPLSPGSLQKNG